MKRKLRMYVLGEDTPDPETWGLYGDFALVLAYDKRQALRFYQSLQVATEVPLDKPKLLVTCLYQDHEF